jgi:hypothetical protein
MALDSNIAMGVRGIELQNPLAQYGQVAAIQNAQNQNALAQFQLESAKRQDLAQNALAAAYKKGVNTETGAVDNALILRSLAESGAGHMIPDVQAKLFKSQQEQAALKKTTTETTGLEFKQRIDKANKAISDIAALNSPEEAMASIDQHLAKGDIDQQKADMLKGQLAQAPSFNAWQKGMLVNILDAKDRLTQTAPKPVQVKRADGSIIFLDENPNSPTFQKEIMPAQASGMTPYEAGNLKVKQGQLGVSQGQLGVSQGQLGVSQGQLRLAQENATKPVFNAAAGGFIAPPTKENPQGKFIPATEIQASKDQQAAVKALQSAGYDPKTGEDNISKLISKSTSGGLQAGSAAALAFFGKSTEGRKAISALEGTANQIATDLAGGKLGAGISNTDRDFIVAALGDVANPMKTSEERLSGWAAAKERMMRVGLIPAPKTGGGAAKPVTPQGTGGFTYLGKEGGG